jgi:2-oxoisovalerate dehydrogenase E1 component alpha subunit
MAKTVTARAVLDRGGLTDEQLIAMLWNMLLQRQIDNRGFQLNRQGKIPFALGSEGHEALHAGAAMSFIRGSDILVPYYRDLGLVLGVGVTPLDLLTNMFAREADLSGGRQFPNHYTGARQGRRLDLIDHRRALLARRRHRLRFDVQRENAAAPCCARPVKARRAKANGTSRSTSPRSTNCRSCFGREQRLGDLDAAIAADGDRDVADKAAGYGLPGMICDGTDPIATYRTMKIAMDRARSGGGPTLVEAKCYRFLSHSTDDDDRTYRDRAEVEQQRKDHDPIPKFERVLLEAGLIDDAGLAAIKADVLKQTNDATDAAEVLPDPAVENMTEHVYAGPYEPWLE